MILSIDYNVGNATSICRRNVKADEILMQVFVHGIVEHLKVHFIILVDAAELVPGQLGDEVLSE